VVLLVTQKVLCGGIRFGLEIDGMSFTVGAIV